MIPSKQFCNEDVGLPRIMTKYCKRAFGMSFLHFCASEMSARTPMVRSKPQYPPVTFKYPQSFTNVLRGVTEDPSNLFHFCAFLMCSKGQAYKIRTTVFQTGTRTPTALLSWGRLPPCLSPQINIHYAKRFLFAPGSC